MGGAEGCEEGGGGEEERVVTTVRVVVFKWLQGILDKIWAAVCTYKP